MGEFIKTLLCGSVGAAAAYIRVSMASCTGENLIITLDEEIV